MTHLPLDVLGLVSPVLSRVEGMEGLRYPETWIFGLLSEQDRDRAWLTRELPTYSFDNIEELLECARPGASDPHHKGLLLQLLRQHRFGELGETLSPPPGYDLMDVFQHLSRRYLKWRGVELFIRQGRMEEIHELGLRFPVAHLIRYLHAEALTTGYVSIERALELPDQLGQLSTTSHGLRTVVQRGISEGHVHFWGVLGAQEIWADHVLHSSPGTGLEGYVRQDRRLFQLSRACMQLMALGILHTLIRPEELLPPFHLISHLDALYFARSRSEERQTWRQLQKAFAEELGIGEVFRDQGREREERERDRAGLPSEESRTVGEKERSSGRDERGREKVAKPAELADRPGEAEPAAIRAAQLLRTAMVEGGSVVDGLLRLIDPVLQLMRQRLGGAAPGQTARLFQSKERIRERVHLVERFHLGIHRMLLELKVQSRRRPVRPETARLYGFLHQVFFRYLVFQTQHWQLATQSGKTTGLRRFKLFYEAEQRRALRDEEELKGLILERLRHTGHLHTVEGRISPPSRADDLVPWVLGYAEGVEKKELKGFGLVIHFLKAEKGQTEGRAVSPATRTVRYGRIRRILREQAFGVYRLLSKAHPAVPFVVGLDAANLELTTPPEVFAPAFRFLREHPIEVRSLSQPWQRFGTYREVGSLLKDRRLGLTYHVGEDFRHLLSGLRAIGEVIEFLQPLPGDRLGHAIALALDPEHWASHLGYQAILPKQELLDTLVWVHHLLGPGHELAGELELEDRIQRLSREIFGNATPIATGRRRRHRASGEGDDQEIEIEHDWSPLTLYDAWRLRQLDPYAVDLERLRQGEYRVRRQTPTGDHHRRWAHVQAGVLQEIDKEVGSNAAYHLLDLYWHHNLVRQEGAKIINERMENQKDAWIRLCREVQEKVRQTVRERQLIVEINPSSNRIVGPLETLGEHHVFKMTLDEDHKLMRELRVTINSDDPGVFNTSLAHEYFLLGEILIRRGVPEADVENWLDWLRANGEDASFARNLPSPEDPRIQKILASLKREKHSLDERLSGQQRIESFNRRLHGRAERYRRVRSDAASGRADNQEESLRSLLRRIEELEEAGGASADSRRP